MIRPGVGALGCATAEVAAHVSDEVDVDAPLHEAPSPVAFSGTAGEAPRDADAASGTGLRKIVSGATLPTLRGSYSYLKNDSVLEPSRARPGS